MTKIDPTNLFGFLVQDIARLMSRAFESQPGDLKITRMQARLLAYISLYEGAIQSEISSLMGIQKIALTKMVDELEACNLVERKRDDKDRRIRRLFMAEGAKPALESVWKRLADISEFALAPIPAQRRKQFLQDLATIRKHIYTSTQLEGESS